MTLVLVDVCSRTQAKDIRASAIRLLSRREYSLKELFERLTNTFSDEEEIGAQLQKLADEGLQSDTRYAESFLRSQLAKLRGPIRIRLEMKQKGIQDEDVERALHAEQPRWDAMLLELSRKKYGVSEPKDRSEVAKRCRFFLYRGFTMEQVSSVLAL